jgi:S1-C subfamily serine protease
MAGRLVGINTAIYSRSGGSDGIGFAIPSNMVRVVAESAMNGTALRRPWIGASLQALTPDISQGLGLAAAAGALVSRVVSEGPCDRAGIRPGDLIVEIDGVPVDDPSALNYRLITAGIGSEVKLAMIREGERVEATIALIAAPETVPRDVLEVGGYSPFAGAVVANLSPAVAEELGYAGQASGVIVTNIRPGTAAHIVGLARGDVVRSVNGVVIDSTRQLEQLSANRAPAWQIEIERGGQLIRSIIGG